MDRLQQTSSQPAGGFYGVDATLILQEFEADKSIPPPKPLT